MALMEPGVYVVGKVTDISAGREWTMRDGTIRQPWEVTLLTGKALRRVQYRDEASARAAAGPVDQTVALRVFPKIGVSGPATRHPGEAYMLLDGANLRPDAEDGGE